MDTVLKVGDRAPEFVLLDPDRIPVSLADFKGKRIVVYFYPKDFTPGCTQEACDFRDLMEAKSLDADIVIGISADAPEKHHEFKSHYDLPFILLSDPDHNVMARWGAWGQKKNYGKTVTGVIRSTFVISPQLTIEKTFVGIKAKGHALRVANELKVTQ